MRSASDDTPSTTPTSQDEADVVDEIGAEAANDGTDGLVIDEETARKEGAIDAESIVANRHAREVVGKKRGNVKNVNFNIDDALIKYEETSKLWPVNTMEIFVKRLTGTQLSWVIQSRPRTGADLYAALKALHGRHEEAEYHLTYRDSHRKENRGTGRIVMPDTSDELPPQQQGQQPMNPYYPPQYPAPYQPGPAYPQPQQQPASSPMQPPPQAFPPPGLDLQGMMAWQRQQFDLWQQMQGAPAAPPAPAPAPQAAAPPASPPMQPPHGMMLVPGFGYVPVDRLFQALGMMPQQPAPPQPVAPQPQMAAATGAPPAQPLPGTMYVPGIGYMSIEALMQAQAASMGVEVGAPSRPASPYRGPYAGPRPAYYPGGAPQEGAPSRPPGYGGYPGGSLPQPPQPPKTAAEQFRDAITLVRSAVDAASQIQSILPGQQAQPEAIVAGENDDSPVSVMDVGGYKLIVNKSDGSARKWETGVANMGSVLKWLGEQREAIQKSNTERAPQRQQLPPGYIEVTPGYQPPPGYIAIPVDELPPPPAQMPPPITDEPGGSVQRRTWGAPTIPGSE